MLQGNSEKKKSITHLEGANFVILRTKEKEVTTLNLSVAPTRKSKIIKINNTHIKFASHSPVMSSKCL
jgi:hypothetical protein